MKAVIIEKVSEPDKNVSREILVMLNTVIAVKSAFIDLATRNNIGGHRIIDALEDGYFKVVTCDGQGYREYWFMHV